MDAVSTSRVAGNQSAEPTLADLQASAARGIDWILGQQRADGSLCAPEDGVGGYYKVPMGLAVAGEWRAANRLLSWVAQHHLTDEGDFRAPERKAGEPIHEAWPVYSNAWIIQGAHTVGRWDIALKGMQYLNRLQLPMGGYYTLDGDLRYIEPTSLTWGGLSALMTGYRAEALRAGDVVVRIVEQQPDPSRFYYRMDAAGNLMTDVPAGRELQYFVDPGRTKQIYYNLGISLIFLCHLYRATAAPHYLEAARKILAFTQQCAEDVFRFPPSGKLGLGCALLYSLTGDPVARHGALSVGAYLLETQGKDGVWQLPNEEPYTSLNRDSFDVLLDITTEFSTFLLQMVAVL